MNINHSTGISYHLRGWGKIERANLNNKICGSTKGYFLHFFICSKISKLPPGDVCLSAQKHFSTEGSEPSVNRSVWFKLFETWKPGWLTKVGKRHVPVIAYGYPKILWVPPQLLWPRAPRTTTKDEKTVEVIRKITNLQLTGKKEYQPYHQKSSVPTWGQMTALGTQGDNILWNTQSPTPPENSVLVMPAVLTCASAVSTSEHTYWSFVSHSPSLKLVDWIDSIPFTLTNDSVSVRLDLRTAIGSFNHLKKRLHLFFLKIKITSYLQRTP